MNEYKLKVGDLVTVKDEYKQELSTWLTICPFKVAKIEKDKYLYSSYGWNQHIEKFELYLDNSKVDLKQLEDLFNSFDDLLV